MKRRSKRLLVIESPIANASTMLRLLEPAGSCHATLRERVYSGVYDKPFVVDNGQRRFLHFNFGSIQSAMDLSDPGRLALAYTRKMMAFLLFNRDPARLLMLGLGGGSIAKFCYRNLPHASLTAIEVNGDVIALRDEFGIPADDARFRVIHGDGATHLAKLSRQKDVILLDAFDRDGMAAGFGSAEFYRVARAGLSIGGVLVANLCGDSSSIAGQLDNLREAFKDQLLTVSVRKDGNIIAFGFKGRRPASRWAQIEKGAEDLKQRFRLDFPNYARRIALHSKLHETGRRLETHRTCAERSLLPM
jgi:spermidine synthase